MTPAIDLVKKHNITHTIHQYQHDPNGGSSGESYGQEAVSKLGINGEQVFKTLVVILENKELVVAVIPVESMLSMKHIARAAKGKKAQMAERHAVERSTGYVLGGVSPLGQRKRLRTYIDSSAEGFDSIFISAGKRGLEIELTPTDLAQLLNADTTKLTR